MMKEPYFDLVNASVTTGSGKDTGSRHPMTSPLVAEFKLGVECG